MYLSLYTFSEHSQATEKQTRLDMRASTRTHRQSEEALCALTAQIKSRRVEAQGVPYFILKVDLAAAGDQSDCNEPVTLNGLSLGLDSLGHEHDG